MSIGEIRVGDIGTIIKLTVYDQDGVVADISVASTKQIIFQNAYGKQVVKNATYETDGTDGILTYTTLITDLDKAGAWKVQGKVVIPAGTFFTDITEFTVHPNL